MKKWIGYTLTLAMIPILSFGGFGGQDVGKLSPVQVVLVRNSEQVVLLTDTKEQGTGEDVTSAVMNMKQTSAAEVFLDTADYLLIEPGAQVWITQLQKYLRPSCNVCYVTGGADLEQAGLFLQLHEPSLTLADYEAGDHNLSCLSIKEGRMQLE